MLHFPSRKKFFENNIIFENFSMSKNNIIFVEPAIQLGYFSIFLEDFAFCLNFIFEWLDFSSHVFCSKMAHKLKVCEQFRTFTGLPMNLSAGKSLHLQSSPSKFSNVVSSDWRKLNWWFLGRNEIKLSKLARDTPIERRSSNTIS